MLRLPGPIGVVTVYAAAGTGVAHQRDVLHEDYFEDRDVAPRALRMKNTHHIRFNTGYLVIQVAVSSQWLQAQPHDAALAYDKP